MLSVVLAAVLAAGASGITPAPVEPIIFPADFMSAPVGVHWSGFDAPAGRTATVTDLLWNQRVASGTGTARFEVLDSGGSVVCFIDVACDAAPGTDSRAACATPFSFTSGDHINLQGNASNACQPSGMLQVVGTL